MTLQQALSYNFEALKKNAFSIMRKSDDLFTGYLSRIKQTFTQEEFETLLKEEVKDVRWYFDTLVFELKEKE